MYLLGDIGFIEILPEPGKRRQADSFHLLTEIYS
jgi:hypothetical protein